MTTLQWSKVASNGFSVHSLIDLLLDELHELSEKQVELEYSVLYRLAFAYVANVTITNYYEYLALKDH
ncbi:hypothetical protein RHMOL_Rhmol04G0161900 [Rhododendron molle]|uniref:Uncharacterized protein n=1 Tax=Rhododendron molle TaxID=49168 RepID=A0ACC0P0Y8_RHOML|nr:hypothetical protein RHMOL_Rhmol04G0161900 [Rhododendron molle]